MVLPPHPRNIPVVNCLSWLPSPSFSVLASLFQPWFQQLLFVLFPITFCDTCLVVIISYVFYCVVDKSSLGSSLYKLNLLLLGKNPAYHEDPWGAWDLELYVNSVVEKHSCYEKCFSNLYPFVFIPINWAILGSDSKLQFLFLSNGGNSDWLLNSLPALTL